MDIILPDEAEELGEILGARVPPVELKFPLGLFNYLPKDWDEDQYSYSFYTDVAPGEAYWDGAEWIECKRVKRSKAIVRRKMKLLKVGDFFIHCETGNKCQVIIEEDEELEEGITFRVIMFGSGIPRLLDYNFNSINGLCKHFAFPEKIDE